MLYRVTWGTTPLFYCTGRDAADALAEARTIAAQTMRAEVVRGLTVSPIA